MSSRLASHSLRSETCGPIALVPTRAGEARRLCCLRTRGGGGVTRGSTRRIARGGGETHGRLCLVARRRPAQQRYSTRRDPLSLAFVHSRGCEPVVSVTKRQRVSVFRFVSCSWLVRTAVVCLDWSGASLPLSSRRVVCRVPLSNAGNLVICDVISASEKYDDDDIASAIVLRPASDTGRDEAEARRPRRLGS
jgi:hypothetical protein